MEMALFHRKRTSSLSKQEKSIKDLTRIITAAQFLAEDRRQALLKKIRDLTHLQSSRYESLCVMLIENIVLYCQSLPETANSYYSQPGGLVDHALNRTEAALSLFEEFMIHDQSEFWSEEQMLWQYALYSAAILQGIGKLFVDYRINIFDNKAKFLKEWNPLRESMGSIGQLYSYEFRKEPAIEFRRRINLLLAQTLMPVSGFLWIASNREVLEVWLALLHEDERSAGTLGAILIRADAIAIQRYFTEFMHRYASTFPTGRYGTIGTFSGTPENLATKEQNVGLEFIQWMFQSLSKGMIKINEAPLFMVPGGMLMCQEIFQLFVREHSEYKNWQAVRNSFLALDLHSPGAEGDVMARFETQNQQMQSGIVFSKYALVLPDSVKVCHSNKVESVSALELINRAASYTELSQKNLATTSSLQKLNKEGKWLISEHDGPTLTPGARGSV
jgi:integrating conjugative element relaxase (TIGR03760 family)